MSAAATGRVQQEKQLGRTADPTAALVHADWIILLCLEDQFIAHVCDSQCHVSWPCLALMICS